MCTEGETLKVECMHHHKEVIVMKINIINWRLINTTQGLKSFS